MLISLTKILKLGELPYLFREGFRRFAMNITNTYLTRQYLATYKPSNLHFKSIRRIFVQAQSLNKF